MPPDGKIRLRFRKENSMTRWIEIRSYNLKPGMRAELYRLFTEHALPMLKRWNVDVVAYGASPHDPDSFYLIRAYASLEARQASEDAFYGSDEWRQGPREAILACIDTYTDTLLEVDEAVVAGLRAPQPPVSP
jgi:hypothetical protein